MACSVLCGYFNRTSIIPQTTDTPRHSLVPWRGKKPRKQLGFGSPKPSDQTAVENKDSVSPEADPGYFLQASGNPLTLLDMTETRVSFMFGS